MTVTSLNGAEAPPDPKRWLALGVIAVSQLMIVLDASIVNIALPSAQRALHISNADRQWVVTAYTLAFGGLLLLGGRVADFMGRKRVFVLGLIGFAASSALGGLAPTSGLLFGARALQGAFAAVMAPAALSLISVTFTETRERARAFGVYGAISGGGAAIGLIAGGLLTEYASWRWCLLVNVPVAILAAVAATYVVHESRGESRGNYDLPGAFAVTSGLVALVYGFTKASTDGWGSTSTIMLLAVAVALLASFVAIELRSSSPLLPMRVILDRNRGGSYLTSLLVGSALFGMFLFLTYYMQGTLGYSALRSGFAFLPFSLGIIFSATLAAQLLPRFGPRVLMIAGSLLGAIGLALLTRLGVHSAYALHILPSELVISVGMGLVFVPLSSTALVGIDNQDAGVASALVNTTQQVGGSLGTALLNTLAATATTSYLTAHGTAPAARVAGVVHGYTVAFTLSAVLLVGSAAAAAWLVRAKRDDLLAGEGVMSMA